MNNPCYVDGNVRFNYLFNFPNAYLYFNQFNSQGWEVETYTPMGYIFDLVLFSDFSLEEAYIETQSEYTNADEEFNNLPSFRNTQFWGMVERTLNIIQKDDERVLAMMADAGDQYFQEVGGVIEASFRAVGQNTVAIIPCYNG